MLTPGDFRPPEVIELEAEADSRGYFATDEIQPGGAEATERPDLPDDPLPVRLRRR
jgi:hypothetical protein